MDYDKGIQCNWAIEFENPGKLTDGSKLYIHIEQMDNVRVFFANAKNRSLATDEDFTIAEPEKTHIFTKYEYPTYVMLRPRQEMEEEFTGIVKMEYWTKEVPKPAWSAYEKRFWTAFYATLGVAGFLALLTALLCWYNKRTGKVAV